MPNPSAHGSQLPPEGGQGAPSPPLCLAMLGNNCALASVYEAVTTHRIEARLGAPVTTSFPCALVAGISSEYGFSARESPVERSTPMIFYVSPNESIFPYVLVRGNTPVIFYGYYL